MRSGVVEGQQDFRELDYGSIEIPSIDPVTGQGRPWLSVMIPSYGAAEYLPKTIESVLSQGLEDSQIQIEVVDDGTPGEAIKEVVERCGQGRVGYYKQAENVGAARNWNTCIERARGQWVHILHDDDWIEEGYYPEVRALIDQHPDLVAVATRGIVIDHEDDWKQFLLAPRTMKRTGVFADALCELSQACCAYSTGLVVKRQSYEQLGGYSPSLRSAFDWHLTCRLAMHGDMGYVWHPYLRYRVHGKNMTSGQMESGHFFGENYLVMEMALSKLSESQRRKAEKRARKLQSREARRAQREFRKARSKRGVYQCAYWRYRFRPNLTSLFHYWKAALALRLGE